MFDLVPWRRRELRRYKGDHPLAELQREMNRLFGDFFHAPDLTRASMEWVPDMDVKEDEKNVIVSAEIPGMDDKDIDISITGDVLIIKGEKKEERKEEKGSYHLEERSYGSFSRSISIPGTINTDKAEADYSDGVLTITLPKMAESKAKKLSIKTK